MPSIIIIGAGPSGIAVAHSLKHTLGFTNFTIYEKLSGPGGTWRTNTYPGCGCDIPSHLYSFSFNLNPHWSKELCDQPEILEYMEGTVDKFGLREFMEFEVECLGAVWNERAKKWVVGLASREGKARKEWEVECDIFISAVGGISAPREAKFEGLEEFQGKVFHTARWDHGYDYKGKRMAIVGNGCSAAQVVPAVVKDVGSLKQYARSAQWYHPRPNLSFSPLQKSLFAVLPLYQRLHRLSVFLNSDALVATYQSGPKAEALRKKTEAEARQYIYDTAPEKYHSFLVPDFPLGCKRRIFDPGYLSALHEPNMKLVNEGIQRFTPTGIVSASGESTDFDVVVLATGFQVSNFLTPMKVTGRGGRDLHARWREQGGAQAYFGTYCAEFPNFGILFGPNTFPAHNSVLFASEVQVEYIINSLVHPVVCGGVKTVEVREEAEERFVEGVQRLLRGTVFEAGCSNWYIGSGGKNSASWPGEARKYWEATKRVKWEDFVMVGGSRWTYAASFARRTLKGLLSAVFSKYSLITLLALGVWRRGMMVAEARKLIAAYR